MKTPAWVGVLVIVPALAACGGGNESDAPERSATFAPICELSPLRGGTGLPAGFPVAARVTFVKSQQAGPSRVVEGYAEGDIEEIYTDWHDKFERSDFTIIFDEREERDAEISFIGNGRSGQVKLADECSQERRVYVRIVSRPTG